MVYKINEKVPVKALADLRESVGWNRMGAEYKSPLMTSYCHIAAYEDEKLIEYLKEKHIYMISVVYEESLKPFYERFGFYNMLCGQMETY